MNYSNTIKCLVTNYPIINSYFENEDIEIEIHNNKKMNLKFNNRFTKYKKYPKDLANIEIRESNEIYKEMEFP